MMGILDWLTGAASTESTESTEVVQRIAASLQELPAQEARYLAAFAYLLGRVASADHGVLPAETSAMVHLVREEGGLTEPQAAMVVEIAQRQNTLFRGTEDFRVAQEFRELATDDQRVALLRCLFAVSAADAAIVTAEDNEIRRISMELKVPYEDFIRARAAMRDKLAVLRPGAGIRPAQSEG